MEDRIKKRLERERAQSSPPSLVPDPTQPSSSSSASTHDHGYPPIASGSSSSSSGLVTVPFTPPKPKREYKDVYDERTFSRTGSLHIKNDALAARGSLALPQLGDEQTNQRAKSRQVVHGAVNSAVTNGELTVHLKSVDRFDGYRGARLTAQELTKASPFSSPAIKGSSRSQL